MIRGTKLRSPRSLESADGLRSPARAHRIFGRRRNAQDRRRGRRRRRRRPGRAGHHRRQQSLRRGQVLQRRAPRRRQADPRRRGPDGRRSGREGTEPARAPGAEPRRLPEPVRAAVARLAAQRCQRPRDDRVVVARRMRRRLDRPVGRRRRRDRPGAPGRRRCARRSPRDAPRRVLSAPLLSRAAALGRCPATRPTCAAPWRLPRASRCRSSPRTRCSSSPPTTHEAHEARVCVADGEMLANPRRVKRFSREQYFKSQAQMEQLFADLPSALANSVEIAKRCNLSLVLGKPQLPDFETPLENGVRVPMAEYFRIASHQGLEARLAQLYPDVDGARARAAALRRAARLRDRDDPEDGLSRLLPDRRRLHQLGAEERLPGRARARLGRRLAGRVFAQHHRPRSAALQAAVRALPQPRAGVDARLRHRLLPGQPRPRDRLRQGEVRARRGEPDRDLRHDGGEGGAARHRPGARHELRPRRLDRQAGAGAAGQDGDAQAAARAARQQRHLRAPRGARDRAAREARGRGRRAARARRARRGPGAQRRHARRRRSDRAGQDHRLLPALHAAGQRQRGEPVRQGRRRGDRPGQVRLPRPGDAHHPRARQGLHRRPPSRAARLRLRQPRRSTTPRSTRSSPKAAPSRCSSSKAAACGAC